jgi:hypothetical protein
MNRYGFKSPQEIEATLSRAQILVMTEAAFWNTYTPPNEPQSNGSQAVTPEALGITVEDID